MPIRKAIFPAAGLGTRFLPATKAQPKEMLPIVDKPIIQYVIEEAVAAGVEDIIIVTGRGKNAIEDHFDRAAELELTLERKGQMDLLREVQRISELASICYIRQEEPLGLGHAIWVARDFVRDDPFAVLLGDDVIDAPVPCLAQMIAVHERYRAPVVAVQRVARSEVIHYGIIDGHEVAPRVFQVTGFVEKPEVAEAPSDLAIIGRYILPPAIFPLLEKTSPGRGGEIQLTDALTALGRRQPIYALEFEGHRYDAGSKLGFLQATVEFALRRPDLGPAFREYLRKMDLDSFPPAG